jgi:hypothetical protein
MTAGLGALVSSRAAAQDAAAAPWYERMQVSADLRLRHDTFLFPDSTPDGKFRFRLRLGMTVPVTPKVTFGLRFSSVEPGAITSENITLTGETAPKSVQLTGAWVSWRPFRALTLTGGKYGIAASRPPGVVTSEILYDDDLAPEGFHQEVSLYEAGAGVLRRVTLSGEQWSLRVLRDSADVWMLAGQAAVELVPAEGVRLGLAGGYTVFHNGRVLAQARNDNRRLLVTNAVVLVDGTILDAGKPVSPTTGNPFLRFESAFQLVTGQATVTVDRLAAGRPATAFVDVVRNTGAALHRTGWAAGVRVGRVRRPGDWAAGITQVRVEREAVLSMFNGSDFGLGGTNGSGPILMAQALLAPGITLTIRDHLVRLILPVDGLPAGRYHRLLLDLTTAF